MTSNCVFFKKNQIYWPLSFTGKLSSDFGLSSNRKFDVVLKPSPTRLCMLSYNYHVDRKYPCPVGFRLTPIQMGEPCFPNSNVLPCNTRIVQIRQRRLCASQ